MSDEQAEVPETIEMRLAWVGIEEQPILLANQFASQFDDDVFIISAGQVAPPLLLGPVEEQLERVRGIPFVAVRPLCRLALTPNRLRALIGVLQENLQQYEERRGEGDNDKHDG